MSAGGDHIGEEHRPGAVKLYVRNDAPFVAHNRVSEVRARLEAAGFDVTVDHWGRRIPWDENHEAHETFEAFVAWAEAANVSLAPAFDRSCHTSEFTKEAVEVLVPPVVTLVAYDSDEARPLAVYPHCDGTTQVSVDDGLERIERSRAMQTA